MAELKTRVTAVAVDDFVAGIDDSGRRDDARTLVDLMTRLTGEPARMWGPSIIGFGSYHYRYDSGREGTMCRIGFSPRARELVLYLNGGFERHRALVGQLGKHRTGKCCLYLRQLAGVDAQVLEQLLRADLAFMDEKYPRG